MTIRVNDLSDTLSLDGEWQCSLDGQTGMIQVPGCWEAQGFPRRVDGPAVMIRTFTIPENWDNKRISLQFDAVSYHVEIRLNDEPIGEHRGLWTSFEFDVTPYISIGQDNHLHLTIYKAGERFPLRESLAGFLPDVAVMFGGIWQSVRLVAHQTLALSDVSILADMDSGEINLSAQIHHNIVDNMTVTIDAESGATVFQAQVAVTDGKLDTSIKLDNAKTWLPTSPHRYRLTLAVEDEFRLTKQFGFRKLSHDGQTLYLNHQPIILRGVLNWGWYPDILCPAPDTATIRTEFQRVRSMGFNMVKLCLYIPSPLYFEIADEEGILLWLELPLWLPTVTDALRQQASQEYHEILQHVHHHPSIVIYSLGCELDKSVDADFMTQLNNIVRGQSCGSLLCDNSGSGEAYGGLEVNYSDFYDYHFYSELHFFDGLIDHFRRDWREARPWIFGEFCDADDFRDIDEIAQHYDGQYPWWLTDQNPLHPLDKIGYPLQAHRMRDLDLPYDNQALMRVSRQQSLVVRKAILEKVRRRQGMGGYVITGLHDTPLATSSVYDDLGRAKYPIEAFKQFNGDTVLLLDSGRRREWTNGGDRPIPSSPYILPTGKETTYHLIISHIGEPIENALVNWSVQNADGKIIMKGQNDIGKIPSQSAPQLIAPIQFDVPQSMTPQTLTLSATMQTTTQATSNRWHLWCVPEITQWQTGVSIYDPTGTLSILDDLYDVAEAFTPSAQVVITNCLTEPIQAYLESGGQVLLLQQGAQPLPVVSVPFWRESIHLLQTDVVPHQGYVDLQFYDIATDLAFDIEQVQMVLPSAQQMTPMMRRLDARQFTLSEYLFGCRVGKGYLLATTLRLYGGAGDQATRLKTNTIGRWVLHQLIELLKTR